MKLYYSFLIVFAGSAMQGQILDKTVISAAYRYTGRNVLQGGLEYKINVSTSKSFIVGASLLYTSIHDEAKFLPEANMYYTNRKGQLLGISLNPYSIEPRIGISLFSIFYLNTGYAFPIHKEKYFKGITLGIQLNIAPFKNTTFYDQFRMM
ncbi:hypothetical protein N6B72_04715 [Chryseobacterium soli]|uniref:hypothetical protein n=1 Tax=Chryseobacterium soli TaxID=445961 RepID=UPI002955908E|nr:hypothetical protein [Chryseobacterium soli]MDV7696220.1 hypothetical protein [Chryseobacterium soli]